MLIMTFSGYTAMKIRHVHSAEENWRRKVGFQESAGRLEALGSAVSDKCRGTVPFGSSEDDGTFRERSYISNVTDRGDEKTLKAGMDVGDPEDNHKHRRTVSTAGSTVS